MNFTNVTNFMAKFSMLLLLAFAFSACDQSNYKSEYPWPDSYQDYAINQVIIAHILDHERTLLPDLITSEDIVEKKLDSHGNTGLHYAAKMPITRVGAVNADYVIFTGQDSLDFFVNDQGDNPLHTAINCGKYWRFVFLYRLYPDFLQKEKVVRIYPTAQSFELICQKLIRQL